MAIVKLGPILSDISGSIAGVTFSRNRGTTVLGRRQRKRANKSDAQRVQKIRYAKRHNEWINLSDDSRLQWQQLAAQFVVKNRLGLPRTLSAYQLYMKLALQHRPDFGGDNPFPPPLLTAPTPFNLIPSITSGGAKQLTISYPNNSWNAWIWGSRPVTTSPRNTFTTWTYLGVTTVIGTSNTPTVTTAWNALLGDPAVGERCGLRVRIGKGGYFASTPAIAATFAV